MNTQYKKGVLNLCALALLHKRDCCGYEISDVLSQHIDIADGTVYPLLRKLKADGLLTHPLAGGERRTAPEVWIIRGFFRRNQEQYRKFAAAGTWREAIA